tara:strand:- start:342 stop:674 length:333 start_codon:yes stop_codon:yes gene_type:complete
MARFLDASGHDLNSDRLSEAFVTIVYGNLCVFEGRCCRLIGYDLAVATVFDVAGYSGDSMRVMANQISRYQQLRDNIGFGLCAPDGSENTRSNGCQFSVVDIHGVGILGQ